MKLNIVRSIIALAVNFLISYGLYKIHGSEHSVLLCIGSLIFVGITLINTIGVTFENPRTTINIRVVSVIFFIIALVSNLVFSLIKFSTPCYVIINGILLLIFVLIIHSINSTKQ